MNQCNPRTHVLKVILVVIALAASSSDATAQSSLDLVAVKDNTLYEEASGGKSNGSGNYFFAGRTNSAGDLRRGLLQFDVSTSFPSGASVRIDQVIVTLHMSKSVAGTEAVALHRVLAEWGEGTSDAPGEEGSGTTASTGDATWTHRVHATETWLTLGGDFDSEALATQQVSGTGFYEWSSSSLTSAVQEWVDNPTSNVGLAVLGNEQTSSRSTKRFDTRENPVAINRPTMRVFYTLGVNSERISDVPTHFEFVSVFPNPVAHSQPIGVRFDVERSGWVQLRMVDMLGRLVYESTEHTRLVGTNEWFIQNLNVTPGTYLIEVEMDGKRKTQILSVL